MSVRPVSRPVLLNSLGEASLASSQMETKTERGWASGRVFEGPAILQGSGIEEAITSELTLSAMQRLEAGIWEHEVRLELLFLTLFLTLFPSGFQLQ